LTREGIDRCLELPSTIDDLVLKAYGFAPSVEAELLDYSARGPRPGFEHIAQIARQAPAPLPTRMLEPVMSPEETAAWHRSIEEADAAMEADLEKFEDRLRSERPDLFDESGAFREDEAQRLLEERVARERAAVRSELAALTQRRGRRSFDAT
jgi:hypothetical protein